MVLNPDGTRLTLSLNVSDLADLLPVGIRALSGATAANWAEGRAADWVALSADEVFLSPRSAVATAGAEGSVVVDLTYPAIGPLVRSLEVRSRVLTALAPAHKQLLAVVDARRPGRGKVLAEVTLDRRQSTWTVTSPPYPPPLSPLPQLSPQLPGPLFSSGPEQSGSSSASRPCYSWPPWP